ncbi:MAG: alpha/beta hydrolase family protein [Gammaproteobacteria bacterium]
MLLIKRRSSHVTHRSTLVGLVLLVVACTQMPAYALSPSDYGELAKLRSVSISPNGKLLAFIQSTPEGDTFVIRDIAAKKVIGGARAGKVKARSIHFATDDHVIIKGSKTVSSVRVRGKWENSTALVYNLKNDKLHTMLRSTEDLYPAQGGLGRIIGYNFKKKVALMPAYIGAGPSPSYNLMQVKLDTGRGKRFERGNPDTIDWFVDQNGTVVAREDFDNRANEHRVYSKLSGKWKKVFERESDRPTINIQAVTPDGKSLVYSAFNEDNLALYHLSLEDGSRSGPFHEQPDRDIDRVLKSDENRTFGGLLYSGLLPEYVYSDDASNTLIAQIVGLFPNSGVHLLSTTEDLSKAIVFVSGPEAADTYFLFDASDLTLATLGSGYPNVAVEQIADVKVVRYRARDDLPILAVLTWPVGVAKEARKDLPLLVFPHGGPESYDSVQFDWWAQYFARQGYMVMQPNFRGSTGFGLSFRDAGRGKWGKEMQDDITDGVKAMVKAGYADADRVCIMGASYGGYAALAGGAFTPDMYRCVVSVAGVSDLPKMLTTEKSQYGSRHWVVSYWEELLGDSREAREALKAVSPANFADAFTAPVLLVHGRDDTVVPLAQSKRMERALRKADKSVELVTLNGEDHWLSTSATRLELLKQIDAFLKVNNPL